MKRFVSAAVLGVVGVGSALLSTVAPAYAQGCSSTQVTVVVQFPDRTVVRCTSGDPVDGFDALKQAGFTPRGVQPFPDALCSIDAFPQRECGAMPPADKYWAYFQARPGGSWTYSNRGPGTYDPQPGAVEGWRFGSGGAPSAAPPSLNAPSPSKAPTKAPSVKPTKRPGGANSAAPAAPDAMATSAAAATSTATATASPPTSSAPASDLPATSPPSAGAAPLSPQPTDTVDLSATSETPAVDGSRGGLSWVWGVALLAVLAGSVGTVLVRRRA